MSIAIGSKRAGGKTRRVLGIIAAAAVAAGVVLTGCSSDDDDLGGDSRLVVADGEEWALCDYGFCMIIMPKANGDLWLAEQNGDDWSEAHIGTWSASDGTLRVRSMGYTERVDYYFISDDVVEICIFGCMEFTRRDSYRPEGGGGTLVLASGEAWTDFHEGGTYFSDGWIFQSNGKFQQIDNYSGNSDRWQVYYDGTYTTNGGILTMKYQGMTERSSYTVDGDWLNLGGLELVRTLNVTVGQSSSNSVPATSKSPASQPNLSKGKSGTSEDEGKIRPTMLLRSRSAQEGGKPSIAELFGIR